MRATPRTATAVALTLLVVLPGCGGDPCVAQADETIVVLQDLVDALGDTRVEDLATLDEQGIAPLDDLEARSTALAASQEERGCSDETMEELLRPRLDEIEVVPGTLGAEIIAGFQG